MIDQQGLSILELMVVIGVLVVMLGLAMPEFQQVWQAYKVRQITAKTVKLLNYARALAVAKGYKVTLCTSKDLINCHSGPTNGIIIYHQLENGKVYYHKRERLTINNELVWKGFGQVKAIDFTPMGSVLQNGTIIYHPTDNDSEIKIIISRTGRVRVA